MTKTRLRSSLMITLDKTQKAQLVDKLVAYFDKELEQDIGQFDAEFLLDFFSKEMGVFFYNQGLRNAQAILDQRMQLVTEAIAEQEKPEPY